MENEAIGEKKYIDGVLHTLCGCGTCGLYFVSHKTSNHKEARYIKGHYCIGKHQTEEAKEKNRQAHLGLPCWNKGKTGIYTEETLKKIKAARAKQVMKKGRQHSDESNEKNRIAHLGKVLSMETRIKQSIALTGKPKSNEHRKNISISKVGERNPGWQGGISKLPYTQDWTDDLRDAIRKRDGHKCQLCSIDQVNLSILLDVHHIDYNKENCDPENLISLCKSCHIKTNRNRDKWAAYFGRKFKIITATVAA